MLTTPDSPTAASWLFALLLLALTSCSLEEVSALAPEARLEEGYWFPFEVDSQGELGDYHGAGSAAREPEGDSLVSLLPDHRPLVVAQMPENRVGESGWRDRDYPDDDPQVVERREAVH